MANVLGVTASAHRRLAVLDTLSRSIADSLPKGLPAVASSPPTIPVASPTSAISGGKLWSFNFNAHASYFDYRDRYAFRGGTWEHRGSSGGNAVTMSTFGHVHYGNGSDPSAGLTVQQGLTTRFITDAPEFEICTAGDSGFRVLVNGEYVQQGIIGNYEDLGISAGEQRYIRMDFGSVYEKRVEIQHNAPIIYLRGIVTPPAYDVRPWAIPDGLKMTLWSDSLAGSVSESGSDAASIRAALHGHSTNILQMLTGQPDIWSNYVGATGYYADGEGTRSNFVERASQDITPYGFDVLWDIGGRNDSGQSAVTVAGLVSDFIETCLASNPHMILIVTGPIPAGTANAYVTDSSMAAIQDGKRDACAAYPRNCIFLPTLGAPGKADPWIFGTGKQGATTGDGNADRILGPDGVHWTLAGHEEMMRILVSRAAAVLPLLRSRIRDGVIEGVNDIDLA